MGLVVAGSSLAGLDLFHVPSADGHVAAVLLEAVSQLLGRGGTVGILLIVRVAVLLLRRGSLRGGLGGSAGAATEHAHDAVGDGVADCDTSIVEGLR